MQTEAGKRIRGIDETTREALRKALSESYQRGEGWAQWLGRVKRVIDCDKPKNRADMIVRTEMAFAYNVALLRTYREMGVEYVEWLSVLDNRTCQKCAERHGNIFPLAEVEGMLPLHPRCRCTCVASDGPGASRGTQAAEEIPDYDAYPPPDEPDPEDLDVKFPFKYTGFNWDDGNAEHAQGHGISNQEAEEAVRSSRGYMPVNAKGGEVRWEIYGETLLGRKVSVKLTERDGEVRVITSQPTAKMPKRMKKRGN